MKRPPAQILPVIGLFFYPNEYPNAYPKTHLWRFTLIYTESREVLIYKGLR